MCKKKMLDFLNLPNGPKNINVQGQFEDKLHAITNNSIVGFNKIEAQKLMQISIKCI
jgi:hypothetical protein